MIISQPQNFKLQYGDRSTDNIVSIDLNLLCLLCLVLELIFYPNGPSSWICVWVKRHFSEYPNVHGFVSALGLLGHNNFVLMIT